MSVFLPSQVLALPHARRIDRLVCAMHADRQAYLARCAREGITVSVDPVRVVITARLGFWARVWAVLGL